MSESKTFRYSGGDNLSVMTAAKRYNESLVQIVRNAVPDRSASVLDFGAGIGLYAALLRLDGYSDVRCLELDPAQAEEIRRQGFSVVTERAALEVETFDAVYLLNVLEHIEDDQECVDWLGAHLRPGGTATVYVPAFQLLFSAMDEQVGHHRRYTRDSLLSLFAGPGWKVQQYGYADSIGFFVTLLYKLVGSREGSVSRRSVAFFDRWLFPASLALDKLARSYFGKNVWVTAERVSL